VLDSVLETVGHTAGYSSAQIAQFKTDVEEVNITARATRQALVQMAQANIDFAHATDLARLAQDAAVIAQINSSEAFTRLITVVQRGSPVMARTMGLTVDFQGAYKRLAEELGKTTLELTAQEKMQARLNEVMAQGVSIAGTYDAAMGNVGKNMYSLSRHFEEAQVSLGEVWLPAMNAAVMATTNVLKAFNALTPEQKRITSGFVGVTTAVTGMAGGFILLAPRIVTTAKALKTLQAALGISALLSDVGVGFTLVASGASAAEVATLGLGATIGGIVLPLAAAAAAATALYIALNKVGDVTDVIRTVPPEIDTLTAASMLLDETMMHTQTEMDDLADSSREVGASVSYTSHEMNQLGLVARETITPIGDLAHEIWRLSGVAPGVYEAERSFSGLGATIAKVSDEAKSSLGGMTDSLSNLAASASSVAGAFGEMTFDDEQLWKMALATGASLEALTALAGHLGIATDAEIQNTMAGYALIEAFEGGAISADALVSGFSALETSTVAAAGGFDGLDDSVGTYALGIQQAKEATGLLSDAEGQLADTTARTNEMIEETALREANVVMSRQELFDATRDARLEQEAMTTTMSLAAEMEEAATSRMYGLSDAIRASADFAGDLEVGLVTLSEAETNAALKSLGLQSELGGLGERASGAEGTVRGLSDALNAIPRDIDVNINIHTRGGGERLRDIEGYQSGSSSYPGGLGIFGEAGPELAVLPRGSRVYPAAQTQQMLGGSSTTWTGNIVINGASDPQTTADAVMRRLQDRGLLPRANLR
jgi:hypothetical protein